MKFTKKRTIIAAVIFFIAIAFTSTSYGQLNFGPYGDGYTAVWLLSKNALKFGNPVNFNNGTLTNINEICLPDGCRTSWSNVTANLSGTLPFSSITGTIFPYQIAAGSIDQSKLGGLTLPFTNITGTISPSQIAAGSIDQSKLGGLTVIAENVTPGTFGTNVYTGDYIFPRNLTVMSFINISGVGSNSTIAGDIQINGTIYGGSPVKISGGIQVKGTGTFNDIFVDSCVGCAIINGTTINATNITAQNFYGGNGFFDYVNVSGVLNASVILGNLSLATFPVSICPIGYAANGLNANGTVNCVPINSYNESGIMRDSTTVLYTSTKTFTVPLPNTDFILVKGSISGFTSPGAVVMQFNDDNQTNYIYRRVQSYRLLQAAVTVNPQRNISMEGYTDFAGNRTIEIRIYKDVNSYTGDFKVTSTPSNINPYLTFVNTTTGSFTWKNDSALTSITFWSGGIGSNITSAKFIVTSERV